MLVYSVYLHLDFGLTSFSSPRTIQVLPHTSPKSPRKPKKSPDWPQLSPPKKTSPTPLLPGTVLVGCCATNGGQAHVCHIAQATDQDGTSTCCSDCSNPQTSQRWIISDRSQSNPTKIVINDFFGIFWVVVWSTHGMVINQQQPESGGLNKENWISSDETKLSVSLVSPHTL